MGKKERELISIKLTPACFILHRARKKEKSGVTEYSWDLAHSTKKWTIQRDLTKCCLKKKITKLG